MIYLAARFGTRSRLLPYFLPSASCFRLSSCRDIYNCSEADVR